MPRKRSRRTFTSAQKAAILADAKSLTVSEVCAKHGIGTGLFYRWKADKKLTAWINARSPAIDTQRLQSALYGTSITRTVDKPVNVRIKDLSFGVASPMLKPVSLRQEISACIRDEIRAAVRDALRDALSDKA